MTIINQLREIRRPLTVHQAADMLGLHEQTIYRWTRAGRIPVLRLGAALRFDPTALADWLSGRSLGWSRARDQAGRRRIGKHVIEEPPASNICAKITSDYGLMPQIRKKVELG